MNWNIQTFIKFPFPLCCLKPPFQSERFVTVIVHMIQNWKSKSLCCSISVEDHVITLNVSCLTTGAYFSDYGRLGPIYQICSYLKHQRAFKIRLTTMYTWWLKNLDQDWFLSDSDGRLFDFTCLILSLPCSSLTSLDLSPFLPHITHSVSGSNPLAITRSIFGIKSLI